MKKLLTIMILLLAVSTVFAKATARDDEATAKGFYDGLMNLASYDKYRDFYENHIQKQDIAYESFEKKLRESEWKLQGNASSRYAGYERKSGRLVVSMDLVFRNPVRSEERQKRVHLSLEQRGPRYIVTSKEIFRMYDIKKKRSGK